MNNLLVYGV